MSLDDRVDRLADQVHDNTQHIRRLEEFRAATLWEKALASPDLSPAAPTFLTTPKPAKENA